MAANLKEHLVDDFGTTYRYLLNRDGHEVIDRDVQLVVEGVRVEATDPLFLLPGTRLYVPPEEGGAQLIHDVLIPVKFSTDPEGGEKHVTRIADESELKSDDPATIVSTIQVRIVRFPVGFVLGTRRKGRDATDAHRRFEIRKRLCRTVSPGDLGYDSRPSMLRRIGAR